MRKTFKRFVKWLKDPCTWGKHDLLIIRKGRCKAHIASVLGGYMGKTDCKVRVYVCSRCHKTEATISNGLVSQSMDANHVISELDAINPVTPYDVLKNVQRWNSVRA